MPIIHVNRKSCHSSRQVYLGLFVFLLMNYDFLLVLRKLSRDVRAGSQKQMLSFPLLICGRTSATSSLSPKVRHVKRLCYNVIRSHLVKAHTLAEKVYLDPRTISRCCLRHIACLENSKYNSPVNASQEICS